MASLQIDKKRRWKKKLFLLEREEVMQKKQLLKAKKKLQRWLNNDNAYDTDEQTQLSDSVKIKASRLTSTRENIEKFKRLLTKGVKKKKKQSNKNSSPVVSEEEEVENLGEENPEKEKHSEKAKFTRWGLLPMELCEEPSAQYNIWLEYRTKFTMAAKRIGIKESKYNEYLILEGGKAIDDIFRKIEDIEGKNGEELLNKFDGYLRARIDYSAIQTNISTEKQAPGESYANWYNRIFKKILEAGFKREERTGKMKERFVYGSLNPLKFIPEYGTLEDVTLPQLEIKAAQLDVHEPVATRGEPVLAIRENYYRDRRRNRDAPEVRNGKGREFVNNEKRSDRFNPYARKSGEKFQPRI